MKFRQQEINCVARAAGGHETGSATLLAIALCAITVVLGLLVADLAGFAAARAKAQAAADAAALAAAPITFRPFGAAGDPHAEAARFAAANGAELVECTCQRDFTWRLRSVAVRVEIAVSMFLLGDVVAGAVSHADFDPTRIAR